ncbi:Uncharacterised protein [Vibrio cholerae]|nr:Uncharacterised protein [Vibrio cholerae]
MPMQAQIRLLRVLQEPKGNFGKISTIGSTLSP